MKTLENMRKAVELAEKLQADLRELHELMDPYEPWRARGDNIGEYLESLWRRAVRELEAAERIAKKQPNNAYPTAGSHNADANTQKPEGI